MSQAVRYEEQGGTRCHHRLILSSGLSDPLKLEVRLKQSRSDQELVLLKAELVELKQLAQMMPLKRGASLSLL